MVEFRSPPSSRRPPAICTGQPIAAGPARARSFGSTASEELTTVHSLNPQTDGAYPAAPLIEGSDGAYYGTAAGGSSALEAGTVFRVDVSGDFTVLHAFDGTDGARPYVALVQASDENFYGATSSTNLPPSSEGIAGTLFQIECGWCSRHAATFWLERRRRTRVPRSRRRLTATFTARRSGAAKTTGARSSGWTLRGVVPRLHTFSGFDGDFPASSHSGRRMADFYGTAFGGANGARDFFRMDAAGGFTTLFTISPATRGGSVRPHPIDRRKLLRDDSLWRQCPRKGLGFQAGHLRKLHFAVELRRSGWELPQRSARGDVARDLLRHDLPEVTSGPGTIFLMNTNDSGTAFFFTTFFRFSFENSDGDDPEGWPHLF